MERFAKPLSQEWLMPADERGTMPVVMTTDNGTEFE